MTDQPQGTPPPPAPQAPPPNGPAYAPPPQYPPPAGQQYAPPAPQQAPPGYPPQQPISQYPPQQPPGGYYSPVYSTPASYAPLPPAIAGRALASYGQRVGAYLLDAIFCLLIVGIIVNPILMGRSGPMNGMSLGKQIVGIRVARADGQPVTIGFALLREWVVRGLLFGVIGWFFFGLPWLLDMLWPLWDKPGQQALHDKIVSSYVTAG